jgi:hypothetical protein
MLQDLTPSSFEEHLGSRFRLPLEGGSALELELTKVARLEAHPGPRQEPFSVFLLGPRVPVLPQRIYRLEHGGMGVLEIFLVPVGPEGAGMLYEAVFN